MTRDMAGPPGLTVIWPPAVTPPSASSFVEMTRSLDMVQERLDAVEAHLAGLAPGTPLAEHHEQELREIQRRVAQLAAELLGADHPLVTQLVTSERPREVVVLAERTPGSWLAGVRVHCFVQRVSFLSRWSPDRASPRRRRL
jgi:hypothetical protein